MKIDKKRYIISQTITILLLLTWIIICIQDTFSWNILLIGALIIFILFCLNEIKKEKYEALFPKEIKEVRWDYVLKYFAYAFLLSLIIYLGINSFPALKTAVELRKDDAGLQLLGGTISGFIGFVSAWFLFHYQQDIQNKNEARKLTEELWFEIMDNIHIYNTSKTGIFLVKLKNSCWDSKISSKLFINGKLKADLSTLYTDIEIFNNLHQQRWLSVSHIGISKDNMNKMLENVHQKYFQERFIKKLKKINAILFGEIVNLGYRDASSWNDSATDWKKIWKGFINNA